MRKISTASLSLLTVLAFAATATAGGDTKKPATGDKTADTSKTKTAKPKDKDKDKDTDKDNDKDAGGKGSSAGGGMAMPDPDPALATAFKALKGSWKCKGTMNDMTGNSMNTTATAKWSQDLDKMWIRGDLSIPKMKGAKRGMKMTFYRTISGGTWYHLSVDNMGGWGSATSTGPDASGKVTWDGEDHMGSQSFKAHDYEQPGEKKGTMHLWGEVSMDGSKWMPAYDMTCSH